MMENKENDTNFNPPLGVRGLSSSPLGGWWADANGYYGEFGGAYIPEILHGTVERLKEAYFAIKEDVPLKAEYYDLLKNIDC